MLKVNNGMVGVPYSNEMIDNAEADMKAQATGENTDGLMERYPEGAGP
jgi:cytochrome c oxidase cbb3-type subunit II